MSERVRRSLRLLASYFIKHQHLSICHAAQITAFAHYPGYAMALDGESCPLTSLLRILLDEHCLVRKVYVTQTGR